jgi:hypothetical protein
VRTNSAEILAPFDESFRVFEKRFNTRPILIDVHVLESDTTECPPTPEHQIVLPLLVWIANRANFAVVDFDLQRSQVVVSAAAVRHPLYLRYFVLLSRSRGDVPHHLALHHAGARRLRRARRARRTAPGRFRRRQVHALLCLRAGRLGLCGRRR